MPGRLTVADRSRQLGDNWRSRLPKLKNLIEVAKLRQLTPEDNIINLIITVV